jgi:hypothetical protein
VKALAAARLDTATTKLTARLQGEVQVKTQHAETKKAAQGCAFFHRTQGKTFASNGHMNLFETKA